MPKPTNIDDYLSALDEPKRASLQALREAVHAVAPGAEECISYQLPAFRLDGMLVAFGAASGHCAFYPLSGSILGRFKDELKGYAIGKGTIRFKPGERLPEALVRRIVEARMADNAMAAAARRARKSAAVRSKDEIV